MKTRIITALVALPFVLLPIWLGGVWCTALFVAVAVIAGLEFFYLMEIAGFYPNRWLGIAWLSMLALNGWRPALFPLAPVLVAGLLISVTDALRVTENPAGRWMSTSVGAIYLGIATGQTLALRQLPEGLWWLLYGLVVAWTNDTAAYFVGVTWGRHKLWPRISPKKTWEGTIAGWIGAAIAGAAVVSLTPLPDAVGLAALIGGVCGVLGLFGDLSISMLKRQSGVKDTGHLIPGHGGVLDRLDSLLFVLPFIATVALLFAP